MKSNYIAVAGAVLVSMSSVLGGILEFYGTETNALIAHIAAASGWLVIAIRDWKSIK